MEEKNERKEMRNRKEKLRKKGRNQKENERI